MRIQIFTQARERKAVRSCARALLEVIDLSRHEKRVFIGWLKKKLHLPCKTIIVTVQYVQADGQVREISWVSN